jgi:exosome complex exonuclease RRP6
MYCDFTPDKRYQLADWRIRFVGLAAFSFFCRSTICRPLPEEMLLYARSDTHFLLYIYDNLRNALLDRALSRAQTPQPQSTSAAQLVSDSNQSDASHALMKEVLARSEVTALRTYEKEHYDAEGGSGKAGWELLVKKWNRESLLADGVQRRVFLNVHAWRDRVAREDDESTRFVLIFLMNRRDEC